MIKLNIITFFSFLFLVNKVFAQQKFEVYTGISESFRSLYYDKTDTSLQNIISLSNGDTKVTSINFGARYRLFDKEYLSFKVGVEVNALGFMNRRITDVRWPSETTPDGYVFDPTLPHDIQTGRKFIYIDMPLAGEIKKSWGKWTPNIQLELVPQYLISIKSITKTEFGTESNFKKPSDNIDRFNLALGASVGSYYNLNDKWSIMINCFYRKQLLGIVDAPITAKLYAFGCNAGVSFNL